MDTQQIIGQNTAPTPVRPDCGERNPPPAEKLCSQRPLAARYVRFEMWLSFVVVTVRRQSPVYLTHSWRQRFVLGCRYSVVSLLLGPWGIPWGLLGTIWALWVNTTGGIDCTAEVLAAAETTTDQATPVEPSPCDHGSPG
jgi:hypothetical protein